MSALQDQAVVLRPIEPTDLGKLNQWKNDEEVYRYLGGGFLPVSMAIQERWMPSLMDTTGDTKRFMIEHLGAPVGMIGLYSISWVHQTCSLGIYIGEKDCRGKGIAKKAYFLLENYAYRYLHLRKVRADVVADNEAAVSMYGALGFRQAGCLVDERWIDGNYHDLLIMEKLLHD